MLAAYLYLAGTLLGGIGLGWIALHTPRHPITSNEERNVTAAAEEDAVEFRDVDLKTPDGAVLRAWFMRPKEWNGDAVILLHGVSDNRLGTYGLKEFDDIHHWVDWIETFEHPHCMFGLGESMGAAQLLQALPKEPRFCAVVAESPFATFREVAYARFGRQFHTGPWLGKTFFRPTVDAGILYVRLRYGFNMEMASPEHAVEGMKIPVLLIHGLDDRNIPPYHSDRIQSRNPSSITVWKVPGAVHTGAHQAAPEEFERRVLGWFAADSAAVPAR